MSLHPHVIAPVPAETARVAHAAFPKGHPYLTFRDALGTIFQDEDFATLFPLGGQPGLPPWRLAFVTIMQFRENLADRQAAEAVRARIDWKYLLSLDLTDPGFDFSVLSAFRDRLLAGSAEELLLDKLLERCRALGLLKARGQQRTDSPHVLAAIRVLTRLELVAETLRATLNALATVAPDWLQGLAPLAWYERYGRRIEDTRLPREPAQRDAYAQTVGEDGFHLLDALDALAAPQGLREFPIIATLRQTWQRHYERSTGEVPPHGHPAVSGVRFKPNRELAPAAEGLESPYDPEARYRQKRDTQWTGYMVHVSETCEPTTPHLLTHVHTTPATVHEAQCTTPIQQARVDGCGSRPGTSTRRCKRRRRGLRARRVSSSTNSGLASKGRSPRGCAPLACAGPGIGVWRRPTCSTSPLPPLSISTASSHGSTDSHGRTRAPPVSPPSLPLAPYPLG